MKREIKFRAWDKEKKVIIYFNLENIYGYEGEVSGVILPDKCTLLNENNKGINKELELMQFTGLKDKKGNEIYEGDLIKWQGKIWKLLPMETEGLEFVCVKGRWKGVCGTLRTSWVRHYPNKKVLLIRTGFEVIGNIYEGVLPKLK